MRFKNGKLVRYSGDDGESLKASRQWTKMARVALAHIADGIDKKGCEKHLEALLPNLARVAADEREGQERNAARAAKTIVDILQVLGIDNERSVPQTAIQVNITLDGITLPTSTLPEPEDETPRSDQE